MRLLPTLLAAALILPGSAYAASKRAGTLSASDFLGLLGTIKKARVQFLCGSPGDVGGMQGSGLVNGVPLDDFGRCTADYALDAHQVGHILSEGKVAAKALAAGDKRPAAILLRALLAASPAVAKHKEDMFLGYRKGQVDRLAAEGLRLLGYGPKAGDPFRSQDLWVLVGDVQLQKTRLGCEGDPGGLSAVPGYYVQANDSHADPLCTAIPGKVNGTPSGFLSASQVDAILTQGGTAGAALDNGDPAPARAMFTSLLKAAPAVGQHKNDVFWGYNQQKVVAIARSALRRLASR